MAETISNKDPHEAGELEGRYANYFKVGYNAFEFLLDFGQSYKEEEGAQLHTRIITSPAYAKTFLEFLWECIERYEEQFGRLGADFQGDNRAIADDNKEDTADSDG